MSGKIKRENDRRVIKTEIAIKEAFVRLAAEQDFRKITISALAAEANIDRKTFYLHYPSIEALMHNMAKEEAKRMAIEMRNHARLHSDSLDPTELMTEINRVTNERSSFADSAGARALTAYVPIDVLLEYLEKPLTEELLKLSEVEDPRDALHLSYGVTFLVAGLLAVYKRWVTEQPDVTLEDISDYLKEAPTYHAQQLGNINATDSSFSGNKAYT